MELMNKQMKSRLIKSLMIFPVLALMLFAGQSNAQNYAVNFDGTSAQHIDINPMIPYTADFTVMGWVNITNNSSRLFSWGSPNVNNYATVEIYNGRLRFYIPTGSGSTVSSSTFFNNAGWKHIAVTRVGNSVKIYVNGILENSGSHTKVVTPTKSTFGAGLFNGSIQGNGNGTYDVFSLWNIELAEADILNYMNNDPIGTEAGIVAFYDFNNPAVTPEGDNTGQTTLTDVSGNGYTGTLNNFSLTGPNGNWVGGFVLAAEPTVTTASIGSILQTTAIGGGEVTDEGSDPVTARGICWNTTGNPTITDNTTSDGTGLGTFISSITGLTESTTYYVKAYATNAVGTAYGAELSFTSLIPAVPLSDWGIYMLILLLVGFTAYTVRKSIF